MPLEAKIQAISQKQVDIDKCRFISVPEILQFDLVPSALFEGDFTGKPEKHLLTTGLEKHFAKTSKSKTSLVIDFMSPMRRNRFTNLQTFKESFKVMWKSILSVCELNQLNIIYDSCIYRINQIRWTAKTSFFHWTVSVCKFAGNINLFQNRSKSFELSIQTKRTFEKFQDVFFITNQ